MMGGCHVEFPDRLERSGRWERLGVKFPLTYSTFLSILDFFFDNIFNLDSIFREMIICNIPNNFIINTKIFVRHFVP